MTAPASNAPPLLRMRGIEKTYPGVRALRGVDLELRAGEVLALVGENGAGKSTLIKILGGAVASDAGSIHVDGRPVQLRGPTAARRAGVSIIYQEFNLVPALTARENIFLGQEPSRFGWLPVSQEHRRSRDLFERIGVAIDPETPCRDLTVAQQQVVEIAKALSREAKVVVMDEPSAALSPRETRHLFAVIRELQAQGIGVIYISHRLNEVFEIADRVMVLRDGAHVGTRPIGELTRDRIIEMMVGRTLETEFPKQPAPIGPPRLVARGLRRGRAVRDVSFEVRRGEVLALTGLVGAGRTETARLIFAADRRDAGTVSLDGRPLSLRSPRDAIAAGICLLTEDRKSQGLVLGRSVLENFGLPNMNRFAPGGFLRLRREAAALDGYVAQMQIKLASRNQAAGTLSGGNQQKIVLAKWLKRNAEVVIFDEPTRGIDVGAKYEIYLLINRLAAQGKAVLMISSELPEVLGMSDRILVMHEGRITGEIGDVARATQEQIMELAVQ
ncbi:MAG: sugar ABC transporter ATP-binding protein [Pirellulaceae bacterium]|jgi:ABC-type sugar transport system ATPase subunit|nr:sugar ABC transporter ATP-binding protein [Pirellulaceae bacterium]